MPGLDKAVCDLGGLKNTGTVYVAVSPYFRDPAREKALQHNLQLQGFSLVSSDKASEPHISVFKRQ